MDTSVFIYYFEDNEKFIPFIKPLFEIIEEGEVIGEASVLSLMEIILKPMREKNEYLVDQYNILMNSYPNFKVLPIDKNVINEAVTLCVKYDLNPPEALQVATAIAYKANAFVTDNAKLKKIKEIEVIVMEETIEWLKKRTSEPLGSSK